MVVQLPYGEASVEPRAGSAHQPDKTLENEWAVVFGIRHPVFFGPGGPLLLSTELRERELSSGPEIREPVFPGIFKLRGGAGPAGR